jgi:hypothetical protein
MSRREPALAKAAVTNIDGTSFETSRRREVAEATLVTMTSTGCRQAATARRAW